MFTKNENNLAKFSKRTLAVLLAVVMTVAMFTCCALTVSAEEGDAVADTTVVWSPLKGIYEDTYTNASVVNPHFSWEVVDTRAGHGMAHYVCDNYSTIQNYGCLTVSEDSELHEADKNAKNGLYKYNHNFWKVASARKNTILFTARQFTEMHLAFTAPSDGYYVLQAETYVDNSDLRSFYASKVDGETGVVTVLDGISLGAGMAGADLKAGDKIALNAKSGGGAGTVTIYDMRVSKYATSTDLENNTITTNYSFMGSDPYNVYGQTRATGKGPLQMCGIFEDKLWDYKATYRTTQTGVTIEEADFAFPKAAEYLATMTSVGQFTTAIASTQYTRIDYTLDDATYGDGPIVTLKQADSKNFGIRFYFTVPEDGNAKITGAYSPVCDGSTKARYRVGIIRKDGATGTSSITTTTVNNDDGTVIEYVGSATSVPPFKNMTTPADAVITNCGDVKAGDILVYEVWGHSGTERYANLSTLGVAITSEKVEYDMNGDRDLNAYDATIIRRFLMGFFGVEGDLTYDISGDGVTDLKDLVSMKKKLVETVS